MSPLQDIACHPLRGRDFDANLVCARDIMLVMPANRGTWPPLSHKIPLCYKDSMKALIISILLLWTSNSYSLVCTASPTNNDPTVITKCYAKLLSHFEQILKQQMAYNYANHLKDSAKLNDGKFRRKY